VLWKEQEMSVTELIRTVQFVVDAQGKKKAVVLDYDIWEKLLILLEDLDDVEEISRLRESDEPYIPWEQAKAELRAGGLDV
jgi:hypothetical protein